MLALAWATLGRGTTATARATPCAILRLGKLLVEPTPYDARHSNGDDDDDDVLPHDGAL